MNKTKSSTKFIVLKDIYYYAIECSYKCYKNISKKLQTRYIFLKRLKASYRICYIKNKVYKK